MDLFDKCASDISVWKPSPVQAATGDPWPLFTPRTGDGDPWPFSTASVLPIHHFSRVSAGDAGAWSPGLREARTTACASREPAAFPAMP